MTNQTLRIRNQHVRMYRPSAFQRFNSIVKGRNTSANIAQSLAFFFLFFFQVLFRFGLAEASHVLLKNVANNTRTIERKKKVESYQQGVNSSCISS